MRSEAVNADKRPVAGRRTLVVTAKGGLLVGDASTGTDNVVVFRYKTSKHDGVCADTPLSGLSTAIG